ncbi:CHASE2 domain-containing protein [Acaryochloris sp. IP29b_bin.137]|uniref:CHASE2 domain-containing protein n=1 Tax=Acaryochloris sp. IP29b_bin.137 TaxID=2969217 RepID=UPI00262ADAF7|nr:CHASE2 domain-containing protein [Acaryochloris sp. IP29b_bin.137]
MTKLLILEIDGDFDTGFRVKLEIREHLQALPQTVVRGRLPGNPTLLAIYRQWQQRYASLESLFRALTHSDPDQITHSSDREDAIAACHTTASQVETHLNQWLNTDDLEEIRQALLMTGQQACLWIQTDNVWLQRLPWERWSLVEKTEATVALALNQYTTIPRPTRHAGKIRILAILGHATDLQHLEEDQHLLDQIAGQAGAEIVWQHAPTPQQLNHLLRQDRWDILFFSGHSASSEDGKRFAIQLNKTEQLAIPDFRFALREAAAKGLRLAIFNSCDGIGLAHQLADEKNIALPHLVFMREKLPDAISPKFLQAFLDAFTQNQSLYSSVQQAQRILHDDWEKTYPCASWLPVVCPNPTEDPPTWQTLQPRQSPSKRSRLGITLGISLIVAAGVIGIREMGLLESVELQTYDLMLRFKPKEKWDERFLIITIDQQDMQFQDQQGMVRTLIPGTSQRRSLSGQALSQLLAKLQTYQPSVIGLDILRPIPASADYPPLAAQLRQTKNFIGICTPSRPKEEFPGVAPPPEVSLNQIGFSDVPLDYGTNPDEDIVRRYLYQASFDQTSPCLSPATIQATQAPSSSDPCQLEDYAFSFGLLIAKQYLQSQNKDFNCQNLQRGDLEVSVGDAQLGDWLHQSTGPYRNQQGEALAGRQVMLHYRRLSDTPRGAVTKIASQKSLRQVLSPTFNGESVRGKIILIGVTEPGADDFLTPLSPTAEAMVPGVYLHAHAISQLLSTMLDGRSSILFWPTWMETLWIAIWAIAGGVSVLTLSSGRIKWAIISSIFISLGGICMALFYGSGLWIPIVPTGIACGTAAVGGLAILFLPRAYQTIT